MRLPHLRFIRVSCRRNDIREVTLNLEPSRFAAVIHGVLQLGSDRAHPYLPDNLLLRRNEPAGMVRCRCLLIYDSNVSAIFVELARAVRECSNLFFSHDRNPYCVFWEK